MQPTQQRLSLRGATWIAVRGLLAFVHLFPARKHLAALVTNPCVDEAWKGVGAALSIALLLMPGAGWAHLFALLRRGWWIGPAAAIGLTVVHVVPALDHLPRFVAAPSWADGWRGLGAALAVLWFASSALGRNAFARGLVRAPLALFQAIFS